MENINRFSLMMDALTAFAEEEQAQFSTPQAGSPDLRVVLNGDPALPPTALFLGMAEDNLPILLDLRDPVPGPLLIVADKAVGKTSFLQMVARAAEAMHDPADVQSAIITPHADEWKEFHDSPGALGIYATQENTTEELLQSLATWAHNNRDSKQTILLLIDDLEAASKISQTAEQNLRWLLLRGPSRRVWTIATLDASRARNMESWLEFFRTRLFGCIKDESDARFVCGSDSKEISSLSEAQFAMREGRKWLKFWAPSLE